MRTTGTRSVVTLAATAAMLTLVPGFKADAQVTPSRHHTVQLSTVQLSRHTVQLATVQLSGRTVQLKTVQL